MKSTSIAALPVLSFFCRSPRVAFAFEISSHRVFPRSGASILSRSGYCHHPREHLLRSAPVRQSTSSVHRSLGSGSYDPVYFKLRELGQQFYWNTEKGATFSGGSRSLAAASSTQTATTWHSCSRFLGGRSLSSGGCRPLSPGSARAGQSSHQKLPCLGSTVRNGQSSSEPKSQTGPQGQRRGAYRQLKSSWLTMLGAWRCSGSTNAELIKNLMDSGLLRSPRVTKAMQATDRGFYVSQDSYEDRPQPIGFKATISAPHMHAHALEVLSPVVPEEGGKILDVGCGSGYLTGALARLAGETGVCYGMDYIPNLVSLSKANLEQDDPTLLSSGRVRLKTGDGWGGWPEEAPFDAIHVGAAAESIPEDLVRQLKVGGRMVVPVGPPSSSQVLMQVDRIRDEGPLSESYTTKGLMSVIYVPLVNT